MRPDSVVLMSYKTEGGGGRSSEWGILSNACVVFNIFIFIYVFY
jgi:hypothetical protein